MSRRLSAWCGACAAAWVLTGCAATLSPDEDPVQIKLKELDTRLERMERVTANQSLLEVANQLEALRADVRAMHNEVDELNHSLDASRKQQHDLYADLDARMRTLEGRAGGAAPGAGATAGVTGESAGPAGGAAAGPFAGAAGEAAEKVSYQAAFDLLKAGQYDQATAAFQKHLATYPEGAYADNAQYWLGEAYYVNKAFTDARTAFQRVLDKYPQSRKVPDALLKLGYCDYELKDIPAAKIALKQVTSKYPDSAAARPAQQRLDKLDAEKL